MSNKKFVTIVFFFTISLISLVVLVNYIVDPYGIYQTNFFKNKPEQDKNVRLIKALKVLGLKPVSISLGTSRVEYGYNPNHKYFSKPSYNLGLSGAKLYENRLYLEQAIKQGNLKEVLLVVDWIMFSSISMEESKDLEHYFNKNEIYKNLFSLDLFRLSLKTIVKYKKSGIYLDNGQIIWDIKQRDIDKRGGHLNLMIRDEKRYYEHLKNKASEDIDQDIKSSFKDFRRILELCYQNDIKLDIIFGPSHIRQWEAYDYYQDINVWYKWKKDVVLFVEQIANEQKRDPYRIMDFSVYHELTAEVVPTNSKEKMKYHWESSHYKKELGDIVLDRLLDVSPYKDFGVVLNSQNIDSHIQKLKDDRIKFIDTKAYRKEVFDK